MLGRDGLGADQFCACFSGNGCGYDQWRRGFSLGFAAFFSAFDHIAAGVALTLAAIAATTLATRAAARTFTFYAFRFIVWLSIFVAQYFIVDNGSCFGAWLALFTWCARLARFTLRALGTHFCSAALAAAVSALRCVQRLAQFAGWALFAWLALAAILLAFTRWARLTDFLRLANFNGFTWLAFFAWLRFFTRYARLTLFARCPFFARSALFTWLALFVAATATAAVLLAAVTTLIATLRAFAGFLLDYRRFCFLFLAGKQADQRFYQALEQARLAGGGCYYWGTDFGRGCRCGTLWRGLDRRFLANQGAGGGGRLHFFHFGGSHFIAGLGGLCFRAVVTNALHFEVRRFQVVVRQDDDACTAAQFDLGD